MELTEKLGVCLDTCHVYSAGYDLVNRLDGVLEHFDSVLGLERLRAIHLNDSMTPFASFKDRHETIGKGSLGEQAFINLINHPVLRELPFFLETPRTMPARPGNSLAEGTLPRLNPAECGPGAVTAFLSSPGKSLQERSIRNKQGV